MDTKTEKKIISEYKKGKSSLDIVKLVGLSTHTILKVLNKHNLVRQRDRCKSLDIIKEDDGFYITRICPRCEEEIKTYSKQSTIACRNHFRKINNGSVCKSCLLKSQLGEGNPFYGKTHSKETIEKISKNRKGKGIGEKNAMYKQENRNKIGVKLKERIKTNPIKYNKVSKVELLLLNEIRKKYPDAIGSFNVDKYICDIFIPSLNLIIEFYGDYWHCNPKKYEPTYYHLRKKKTSEQIWSEDKIRVDNIKKLGYDFIIIWEEDFKIPSYVKTFIKKLNNVKN
jgi:hypothetical protein